MYLRNGLLKVCNKVALWAWEAVWEIVKRPQKRNSVVRNIHSSWGVALNCGYYKTVLDRGWRTREIARRGAGQSERHVRGRGGGRWAVVFIISLIIFLSKWGKFLCRDANRAPRNMLGGWPIGHPVLRNGHPVTRVWLDILNHTGIVVQRRFVTYVFLEEA